MAFGPVGVNHDVDLSALKARLADVPGISGISLTEIGGRHVFAFNGLLVGIDPASSNDQIDASIRRAAAGRVMQGPPGPPIPTPMPTSMPAPNPPMPPMPTQPQAGTMSTPAKSGFAAGLKQMMDEARAGIEKARQDGLSQVQDAVGKLNEAKAATTVVAGKISKTIHDEAADVMAELGQITNDLTGEA